MKSQNFSSINEVHKAIMQEYDINKQRILGKLNGNSFRIHNSQIPILRGPNDIDIHVLCLINGWKREWGNCNEFSTKNNLGFSITQNIIASRQEFEQKCKAFLENLLTQ